MTEPPTPRVRCRTIAEADAPALAALLAKGFPERTIGYWQKALETLARRDAPEDYPRFGYLLEREGAPIGVILMIFTRFGENKMRCNLSSWYVEEAYRGYASLLIAAAVRHKDVTYVNISPAPFTWRLIEAQGFRRYCDGQMLAIPALARYTPDVHVAAFDAERNYGDSLSAEERDLLMAHVERGCLALIAHEKRDALPFVFMSRHVLKGLVPTQQLIYCRDFSDVQRLAGPLGRELLKRGQPTILLDATEKIPGLVGIYLENRGPKYFKGPERPRLGDLAFCENVLFGP